MKDYTVYSNINEVLTLKSAYEKDGRNLTPYDIDIVKDASVAFTDNEILWVGPSDQLPNEYSSPTKKKDFNGLVLTPELVDSHTHTLSGGNRADEYMMRLNGADYQEIANSGGGILSTSLATNKASANELFDSTCERIETIASRGVTTIEIKSGYALNLDGERKCSLIIDRVKKHFATKSIQIFNTYMAAHAVPKNYNSSKEYMDEIVLPLLKELSDSDIVDAADIFHEGGYFTAHDAEALFDKCRDLTIATKIHADEFQDNGGACLAAKYGSLSADHLLCVSQKGIESLSNSSTVATLLPGTGYFLGKPQANGKELLASGCKVSIASDFNPGSCHYDNLLQIASQSAPMYPMNATQLWASITLNSAAALGFTKQGAIIPGLKPRFSTFKANKISEITYNWGNNLAVTS